MVQLAGVWEAYPQFLDLPETGFLGCVCTAPGILETRMRLSGAMKI